MCGQLRCSYCSEHRALVLNSPRHKNVGGLLDTVVGQRIWLFLCVAYSCTNRQKTGSNICFVKLRIPNCT